MSLIWAAARRVTACKYNKTDDVGYVRSNSELASRKHCCIGEAANITQPEYLCVFVALGTRHKMGMRRIATCGLQLLHKNFSTFSHKRHNFRKKGKLLDTKCVFWFWLQLLSETFLILRRNEQDVIKKSVLIFMYSAHYSWPIFVKLEFFSTDFRKIFKFHQNPSSGSRIVPCGRTDGKTRLNLWSPT